ncbi:peroxisomal membrane anchor protein conserved region domain-containing protein [Trichoderma ceciliae]
MAIREELVVSAAQFLQDPSVATSSVENKIQFLRTKNLTQEEIDAALARAGSSSGAVAAPRAPYPGAPQGPPQQYYQSYPQYAWQPPASAPKRDWRDWFIMATVVGGVSYGLYSLGKRYVYPLVAPPTPEKLEQDKKSIEEQFDKAFALVEQLSKDTEALKDAEKQRTERLDVTLADLDTIMTELKSANRRREDDAQRIRDEVQGLKDAIPRAMNNQKELTDNRLAEINTELTSLKTLVSQRMNANSNTSASSGYFRGANGINGANGGANGVNGTSGTASPTTAAAQSVTPPPNESAAETSNIPKPEAPKSVSQNRFNRASGLSTGSGPKASIPAWQMAMANQNAGSAGSSPSGKEGEKATTEAAASSS